MTPSLFFLFLLILGIGVTGVIGVIGVIVLGFVLVRAAALLTPTVSIVTVGGALLAGPVVGGLPADILESLDPCLVYHVEGAHHVRFSIELVQELE